MPRRLSFGFLLVLLLVIPSQALGAPAEPRPQSDGSRVYWGAYVNGAPFDMSRLEAFEANTGRAVSIVHWGQPWYWRGTYQKFPAGEFDKVRAHGAIPMINWNSWALGNGIDDPDYQLRDVYEGLHDDYIRQWASAARDWGHPFFLRFNHEMNGTWFPWSEQVNGNQPGEYILAWRHVHDLFAEVGANNVTWVWCPNVDDPGRFTPLDQLYPGDDYVDWVAMDGYNWGTDHNGAWQTFAEVFQPTYDQLLSLAPGKPIMIGETSSSEDGGPLGSPDSKAAWIRDAFQVQLPINFYMVKAVVWFNWNASDDTLDWPIESSQASIDAFAESIASEYYASNDYGDLNSFPIPPLADIQYTVQIWMPIILKR